MKPTSVSTATASGGVVGALVVIICWGLNAGFKIEVPAEVAAALMVFLTPILHVLAVRFGFSGPPDGGTSNDKASGPP